MKTLRVGFLVAVFGITACSSLVTPDTKTANGFISLRNSGAANSLPFTGPYVSVLDSLLLTVTSDQEATSRLIGRHLRSGDTSFILPVTLPEGQASFAVQVLSNNNSTLQNGQASATIDKDGFSVAVQMTSRTALMVAQPDTITASVRNTQTTLRTATAYVYNRGSANLIWRVKTLDTSFTRSPCVNAAGAFACITSPAQGVQRTLIPNGLDSVTFAFPDAVRSIPFLSSRVFSFVLGSNEGDVTVRWRWTFP